MLSNYITKHNIINKTLNPQNINSDGSLFGYKTSNI